jgi:alanine dehydrogenase
MALLLTRKDVESVLTMAEAIAAVEEAFRQQHLGTVDMPLRPTIRIPKHSGVVLFMPAYIGGEVDALGMKVVSVYPNNPTQHNLPTTLATILLHDPQTGSLLGIMDGTFITAMRTGAVSGVATKYLARQNAKTVGIFGAGVQARTQLAAMCAVRKIGRVLVYDAVFGLSSRFCAEMGQKLGLEAIPVENPREAVNGADIIITASTAREPVFQGDWLAPGTHINGVGSHSPDSRELDTATIRRAKIVVDLRQAALKEAGDLLIPLSEGAISEAHIYADLGEIVSGKPGRMDDQEITLFKSVGLALQDVATARRVYDLAWQKGIGQELPL